LLAGFITIALRSVTDEGGSIVSGDAGRLVISHDIGAESDAEDLANATYRLRRELAQLDVDDVTIPRSEQASEGSRGPDLGAIGTLIVTLGQDSALSAVISALLDWASRDSRRRVRVELDGDMLDITGLSEHDQRRIINHWLRRHPGR
jgi:hypothetical protein